MRLLLFAGTGGAGTTTVAAATAVHAARRGVKTLLLAPEPTAAPPDAAGDAPVELEPGLVARRVDARARARRGWDAVGAPAAAALRAMGVDPFEAAEFTGLPALDDVLTLLEIRDAAAAGWDLVVVDLPALARAVQLLALPQALARTLDRALPLERRMLWAMGHGGLPAGSVNLPRGFVEAAERVRAELTATHDVLVGAGASVRLVMTPEAGALAQATHARTRLALHGLAVDAVVVNRLMPAGDDAWRQARAAVQAQVLADADAGFAPLRVGRLSERAVPPAGLHELTDLADELAPEIDAGAVNGPAVERDGNDFVLVLPLPAARRGDVELARRADELVVDVAGERRVLALPSVLRRCDVTTAALRDGALRVSFRPDPELWRSL